MGEPAATLAACGGGDRLDRKLLRLQVVGRSGLAHGKPPFTIGGYRLLVALTSAFTHVLSGGGASNQIGAIIGTIRVANVFPVITPNQKKIVAALTAGKAPNRKRGKT